MAGKSLNRVISTDEDNLNEMDRLRRNQKLQRAEEVIKDIKRYEIS